MHDDELDLLIDAALTTYADPGPESELARRVLDRIAAEPAPRRSWLLPALVLPIAACLLLVFLIHPRPRITAPRSIQTNQAAHLQKPEELIPRTQPPPAPKMLAQRAKSAARNSSSAVRAAHSEPLPKLDVFPTPEPLSPQERALAVLAARTPQAELQALAKSQQQEVPPTIASLHVMPLEPPDKGEN